MANSLTAEQRKRITSREQKSCKSQSSPFSSPSTMQRKERDVRENGSISLYSFLPTRWGKWCVSRQAHFSDYPSLSLKQEAGCQFAFLQHSDEAVSLAHFFISRGVITDLLFFLSPHGKSIWAEPRVCTHYQPFSPFLCEWVCEAIPPVPWPEYGF